MSSDKAKRGLFLSSVLGTLVGLLLGYVVYGNILDVRAWNLTGLIFIAFVGGYAAILGVSAYLEDRRKA